MTGSNSILRSGTGRAKRKSPRGITLLEVILAIAILGMSLVALSQLVMMGNRSAGDARTLTQAQLLCESKMSEIRASLLPLQSATDAPIEDVAGWLYSVDVQESEIPGLLLVKTTVRQTADSVAKPISFELVRFMPDPEYQPEPIEE